MKRPSAGSCLFVLFLNGAWLTHDFMNTNSFLLFLRIDHSVHRIVPTHQSQKLGMTTLPPGNEISCNVTSTAWFRTRWDRACHGAHAWTSPDACPLMVPVFSQKTAETLILTSAVWRSYCLGPLSDIRAAGITCGNFLGLGGLTLIVQSCVRCVLSQCWAAD